MDDQALTALLLRFQQDRDPAALETLFEATAPGLAGIARRLATSQADADDLLQSTFLAVLESIDRFRPDQPAMGWLIGILTNKALYHRRQAGRTVDPERLEQELPPLPDLAATRAEEATAVRGALAGLPELYRRVLEMVLGEGMPPSEIAERLDRSPGAVRTQLHRGIAMLRRALPAGVALPSVLVTLDSSAFRATRQLLVEKAREKSLVATASSTATPGLVASLVAGGALVAVAALASNWTGKSEPEPIKPATAHAAPKGERLVAAAAAAAAAAEGEGERVPIADPDSTTAPASPKLGEAAPHEFEFRLRDDQGFSFERMAVVDEEEADLFFPRSNRLETQGLLVQSAGAPPEAFALPNDASASADAYLRALVAIDPEHPSFASNTDQRATQVRFRDRDPAQCVWVLRLHDGRWAAIARVNEVFVPEGPPNDPRRYDFGHNATIYHGVIAGADGVFQPGIHSSVESPGMRFRRVTQDPYQAGIKAGLAERIAELEARVDRQRPYAWPTTTDESQVHGVLARRYAGEITSDRPSYVTATFSFDHGTRSAPEVRGDWSFVYDRGTIDVATVTDDRSRVWNLGRVGFMDIPSAAQLRAGAESLQPKVEDLLLIHTLDGDSNRWDLLKVLAIDERMLVFQWLPFEDEAWFAERTALLRPSAIGPRGVWIQIRGGAGGGNPNRAFFDGNKNAYVDELLSSSFDVNGPVDSKEDCRTFVQGGGDLAGHVWEITSIEYSATTVGDSNGPGGFRVVVDGEVIVDIPESDTPSHGVWTGSLAMKSASDSYVEIRNSTSAEVRIQGEWRKLPDREQVR